MVFKDVVFIDCYFLQLNVDEFLYAQDKIYIVLTDDCEGLATTTRSRSSSNSMHIVFWVLRHVVVEHHLHGWNIKTTRSDVCGYQILAEIAFELKQVVCPGSLIKLTVDECHVMTQLTQKQGQKVAVLASRGKNDALLGLLQFVVNYLMDQICFFNVLRHQKKLLLQPFNRLCKGFISL